MTLTPTLVEYGIKASTGCMMIFVGHLRRSTRIFFLIGGKMNGAELSTHAVPAGAIAADLLAFGWVVLTSSMG